MPEEVMTSEEFFTMLDEVEREEGGGGGYVGLIRFELGFKVFAPGMSNAETWFPFSTSADKAMAKAKASALAKDATTPGQTVRKQLAYGFWLIQDEVMNRDVDHWQGDRFWCYPFWTPAAKEVIKPSLETCAIYGSPYEFYGRLTFCEEPSGRTRVNQEGEEVPELVAYPSQKFASKEEAQQVAVGEMPVPESGAAGIPELDEIPDWLVKYAKEAKAEGKSPAAIAKETESTIQEVVKALEM